MLKDVFEPAVTGELKDRINHLAPQSQPKWGKMSVAQMLAHCNVTYELVYDDKHRKPNAFMRRILKLLVKRKVTDETPYKPNMRTAPAFMVTNDKNFGEEKKRLIHYIDKTQQLGGDHFNGKESHSFGALTRTEWNNMFFKHLDHHLRQFGV